MRHAPGRVAGHVRRTMLALRQLAKGAVRRAPVVHLLAVRVFVTRSRRPARPPPGAPARATGRCRRPPRRWRLRRPGALCRRRGGRPDRRRPRPHRRAPGRHRRTRARLQRARHCAPLGALRIELEAIELRDDSPPDAAQRPRPSTPRSPRQRFVGTRALRSSGPGASESFGTTAADRLSPRALPAR